MKKLANAYVLMVLTTLSFGLDSCKKDVVEEPVIDQQEETEELFYQSFTDQRLIVTKARDCFEGSFTLPAQYQRITAEYRYTVGDKVGDEYFYGIEERLSEFSNPTSTTFFPTESNVGDWQQTEYFFRYSFEERKSYLYHFMTDSNPKLLFDFNVSVGDTIELINNSNVGLIKNFIVDEIQCVQTDGVEVPKIRGRVYCDCPVNEFSIYISPNSPYPFAFPSKEFSFDYFNDIPWTVSCGGINPALSLGFSVYGAANDLEYYFNFEN